jgi:Icc-related predicted phosphoesterase
MRALVVSDLHYGLRAFDWVVANADDYDIVVIAGDMLDIRSYVEPDAQIAVVLEYLARLTAKTTVVACSGNHDLNAENELGERAAVWLRGAHPDVHIDGGRIVTDDVYVTVCPWWDGPKTRAEVDQKFAVDAGRVGDRIWVWVYHAPPDQSPTSWTGKRYYGDAQLNAWIEQYEPALVLCGHVHESPFVDDGGWADRIGTTLIVNAGREPGPVPPHVVIDTDAREITWRSAADRGALSFARDGAQYSG